MNRLTIRPDRLERLRAICLALPEAAEKITWGDPTWRVRDRMFALQKGNVAGHRPSLWVKAAPGVQTDLVDGDSDLYFVPPYVGGKGWVGLYLDGGRLPWDDVAARIEASYRLIAPRRLVKLLDAGG
jgi:predicted DNA-binding protein (MmcQ/YjbR family)